MENRFLNKLHAQPRGAMRPEWARTVQRHKLSVGASVTLVGRAGFEAGMKLYFERHDGQAVTCDDFAQAIRAIGEPIHQRRADEISMAKVLTLLFDVTALFDMSTRTELVMLQKTMVVVEGVARSLDPRLDMWTSAEPVVRAWLARNLGPIGRADQARRAVLTLADVVADVPDLAQRAKRVLVRLDEEGLREVSRVERRIRIETKRMVWSTLALWAIAGSLLAIALR